MKFAAGRRYSDPEKAARKILEIANSVKAAKTGASPQKTSMGLLCTKNAAVQPNRRRDWA